MNKGGGKAGGLRSPWQATACPILLLCLAAALRADSAQDVHTLFENAAAALSNHQAGAFLAAFDPSLPGSARLKANVSALLKSNDTASTIEWQSNEGDDQARSVRLNWLLDVTAQDGAAALTHRRAQVQCRLARKSGQWRIVSFAPADFFAPPQAGEAWAAIINAAEGLTESVTGGINEPAANARKFLEAFDPNMPGYARLKDNVLALGQRADIESSVDLVRNEGDDGARTIEVDWTMNLVSHDSSITAGVRTQVVTLRVEKQGKAWRITSLDPQSFFLPLGVGKTPLY